MAFLVLTQDEQDEILVDYLRAQERDLFTHGINVERFEAILTTQIADADWEAKLIGLRDEGMSRIREVQGIIDATVPQLPSQARIDVALAAIKARETASQTG